MEILNSKKDKLIKLLQSQAFYEKLGLAVIKIIKDRTRSGKDVEGKSFGSYSKSYIKVRERHNLPTHPVSMTFDDVSGMLTKIDHVVANDFKSVSVFFNDKAKQQIAYYWNVSGAGKNKMKRQFWGVKLQSELTKLSKIGYNLLKGIIKNL